MKSVGLQTIARKELRSYFLSPVALIFLGLFLVVTLFYFFYYAKFFSRNLADVRPLFQSLPFLLIFLVAAVTMRQWSEEQKMGTLEILLTLPVRTRDLVLGKFVAGSPCPCRSSSTCSGRSTGARSSAAMSRLSCSRRLICPSASASARGPITKSSRSW